jgi:integrase
MDKQDSNKPASKVFIFGKTAIEALPVPAKGKRTIHRDQRYQYLFLRVTPTSKAFYFQQTVKGQQHTVTIGKYPALNADQARDIAKDHCASYAKGENVAAAIREARTETTLFELWSDFRVNRSRGRGRISESYEYMWNRHFKRWMNKPLSEITYDKARKLILNVRSATPIHANRLHRFGKAMFNHGISELRIEIQNPFLFSQVSEKGRSRKDFRLQKSDMPAFMAALDTLPGSNMKDLFLTSLFSGRRVGEVRAMRWVDVDLQSGIWVIPNTKSGMSQTCVLPKPLVQILLNRMPVNSDDFNQWVFPSDSKTGHVISINTAWKQVRSHGFQHLQCRDLRGTLASWLQEVGVPLVGAQQQLGHADSSTTATHYTSISNSLQRIGMDSAVNAMLEAAK